MSNRERNRNQRTQPPVRVPPVISEPVAAYNVSTEQELAAFFIISYGSLIIASLSILCSLLVLYKAWKHKLFSNINLRFPIYFACIDILFCVFVIANSAYGLSTASYMAGLSEMVEAPARSGASVYVNGGSVLMDDMACTAVGATIFFLGGLRFYLVFGLALYVYFVVCNDRTLNYGVSKIKFCGLELEVTNSNDFKYLFLSFCMALVPIMVGIPIGAFGPMKYWCQSSITYFSNGSTNVNVPGYVYLLMVIVLYLLVLVSIVYFYVSVLVARRTSQRNLEKVQRESSIILARIGDVGDVLSENSTTSNTSRFSSHSPIKANMSVTGTSVSGGNPRRTTQKLISHISVFFVQWFPTAVLMLAILVANSENVAGAFYIVAAYTVSAGGILNFVTYYFNERWRWSNNPLDEN